MCAPILPILAIGSSVVSTVGKLSAARKAEKQGEVNAQALIDKGNNDALLIAKGARRQEGANRVFLASNGVAATGSALDVLFDNAVSNEINRLDAIHSAKVGADATRARAGNEASSLRASAFGEALTAAGGFANTYFPPNTGTEFPRATGSYGTQPTGQPIFQAGQF